MKGQKQNYILFKKINNNEDVMLQKMIKISYLFL